MNNDPKYITGTIINSASGEAIPADEPCFILRGRDVHAVDTLFRYLDEISDPQHIAAVKHRIGDFIQFRNAHPDRMKTPDTDLQNQGRFTTRSEETGDEVGAIAARLMKHADPEVRALAASALTQRPDRG